MANLNEQIENESVILERDSSKLPKGVLARVSRIVCWLDERNANNRKYGKDVWETTFNRDDFKRKMDNRTILGEYEHPESSALKLDKDRTSHIVSKMYVGQPVLHEGRMRTPVKAEFDLLPTDAGKFILILHEAGVKVGASTRADGSLMEEIDEDGSKYMRVDPKDYKFVTIDHTGDPSCQNTEPESIINAVQSNYENHTINKNVAIALLESVQGEAAKALEKLIKDDKQHAGCKCKLSEKGCAGGCGMAKKANESVNDKYAAAKEKIKELSSKIVAEKDEAKKRALEKERETQYDIKDEYEEKWKELGGAHESKANEEYTTSSDTSGQPANLAAAKEDMMKSKARTEETDKKMQSVADRPVESVTAKYSDKETEATMKESKKVNEESVPKGFLEPRPQPTVSANIGDKVKEFLGDNWNRFMNDSEMASGGSAQSRDLDAIANVVKVFKVPEEQAKQYVGQLHPAHQNESIETEDPLASVKESYVSDVIRYAGELAAIREEKDALVRNYSNDSVHFANARMELERQLSEKISENSKLQEAITVKQADHLSEKAALDEQVAKLTEEKNKLAGELNEKIDKLGKELASKETAIKESEKKQKLLQEAHDKKVKDLNEAHQSEIINLYVDSRVKGMGLRLHEKVLTLLRQSKSTKEVDSLIRETQDALREGLTQSVGRISEVTVARPVDKNQADINAKVGIALKHFGGL